MNEETLETAQDDVQAAPPAPTAGQILREAREAAGLHIALLAVSLKVTVKKIEALEADRYDELVDAVFIRGLASSVCRHLKIDPVPVMALLPSTSKPRLALETPSTYTPFQTASEQAREPIWNQISRPALLVALVLLVGALVLILFPVSDAPPKTAPARVVGEPAQPVLPSSGSVPSVPEAPSKPAFVVETVVANPALPAPAASPVLDSNLPPVQGKSVTSGLMVLSARAPAWVEVTDAAGVVQIRRKIVQGEVVGVSGQLPMSVVLGRADMTDVVVFGKPFPTDALSKGNVARFEVK